jgi:hypothetical protein
VACRRHSYGDLQDRLSRTTDTRSHDSRVPDRISDGECSSQDVPVILYRTCGPLAVGSVT